MMDNFIDGITWQGLDYEPHFKGNPSFQSSWTTRGYGTPSPGADRGMYFIWDFTQLNVRPHSRVGLLKYKTAPKCSLSGPFRHSGVGRNPGAVGPVRSYNLNFTYPCQPALGGVELPFPVGVVRAANLRFGQTSMEGLARRLVVVLNRSGAGCAGFLVRSASSCVLTSA